MADYINKVIIKGRLVKKAEARWLPSGDCVTNFSLATQSGDHVEFHDIVAYKHLAERAINEYDSGDMIYCEGMIKTREFLTSEDKLHNRKARKVREVIADELHLVYKKGYRVQQDPQLQASQPVQSPTKKIADDDVDKPEDDYIPKYI